MKLMRIATSALCLCCAVMISQRVQATENPNVIKSCKQFVQSFYEWYAQEAQKENRGPSWIFALENRPSAFSPKLAKLLKEDSDSQSKSPQEIVGLDFDPFLNSQDPDERYAVGKIVQRGDTYWVDIYSVRSGQRSDTPDVVPELKREGGKWRFVNFHYLRNKNPQHENLLSILNSLRVQRQNGVK
jgi:hypothetical protein